MDSAVAWTLLSSNAYIVEQKEASRVSHICSMGHTFQPNPHIPVHWEVPELRDPTIIYHRYPSPRVLNLLDGRFIMQI